MTWRSVLNRYPADCQPTEVRALGTAGGHSGAQFWRLTAPGGELCLRRWPREHPTPQRLRAIHNVLAHAWDRGLRFIPRPMATRDARTFVQQDGYLWELTAWLPGWSDYHARPSEARLRAAMQALAAFHAAAAAPPVAGASSPSAPALTGFPVAATVAPHSGVLGPCPAVGQRLTRLRDLMGGGLAALRRDVDRNAARWPEVAARAAPIFSLFGTVAGRIERGLSTVASASVPLQPCIRDIWHDHVLFEGEAVSGLIDFGAMRTDNVACDIARLLGSLVRDDPAGWEVGMSAYEATAVPAIDRRLVSALDESGVLLSALCWLEWVFREGRRFDSPSAVISRVDEHVQRLANLACDQPRRGDRQ